MTQTEEEEARDFTRNILSTVITFSFIEDVILNLPASEDLKEEVFRQVGSNFVDGEITSSVSETLFNFYLQSGVVESEEQLQLLEGIKSQLNNKYSNVVRLDRNFQKRLKKIYENPLRNFLLSRSDGHIAKSVLSLISHKFEKDILNLIEPDLNQSLRINFNGLVFSPENVGDYNGFSRTFSDEFISRNSRYDGMNSDLKSVLESLPSEFLEEIE